MKTPALILIAIFSMQCLFAQQFPYTNSKELNTRPKTIDAAIATCDTIDAYYFSNFELPVGVTWDGANLWVLDFNDEFIFKLDANAVIIDSIPTPNPNNMGPLGFDGEYLLVIDLTVGKLLKLNREDGSIYREFQLPSLTPFDPHNFGVAFDGEHIWSSHWSPGILFKVDNISGDVVQFFDLPVSIGGMIADGKYIYGFGVASIQNPKKMYTIDKSNGVIVDSLVLCGENFIDLTFDGSNIWAYTFSYTNENYLYKFGESFLPIVSSFDDIDEQATDILTIFPNPTYDQVTIDIAKVETINIIDAWGKIIAFDYHDKVLDLSAWPAGVYFIIVDNRSTQQVERIIKL